MTFGDLVAAASLAKSEGLFSAVCFRLYCEEIEKKPQGWLYVVLRVRFGVRVQHWKFYICQYVRFELSFQNNILAHFEVMMLQSATSPSEHITRRSLSRCCGESLPGALWFLLGLCLTGSSFLQGTPSTITARSSQKTLTRMTFPT